VKGVALKGRSSSKALQGIKQVRQGVRQPAVEENPNKKKQRLRELPDSANVLEETTTAHLGDVRKTKEFETITLHGSKGEKYTVVVPASYASDIPKVWKWTSERYRVAELVAEGIPFAQIPSHPGVGIKSRMTIYCWLEHPEFKSHVDGLVMETGWANRRERMAKLERLNEILLSKVVNELPSVKLTDKMAGALLSAINANAKMLAQEKGEFIEETKVTQDTNISGTLATAKLDVNDFLKSKASEDQKELMKEFESMGDDIIRSLTGDKN
jgi:hypothetical protein